MHQENRHELGRHPRLPRALPRATPRGAARALHVDQATVGRRLASPEAALGSTLFLRTSSGYLPTPAGEAAFELAEKMERSALELLRRTRGMDHRPSGEVRLSTTDSLAVDFVLPALARLHLEHPDIRVLFNSASAAVDPPKRETDIAIRTLRPENPDLIPEKTRQLAHGPVRFRGLPAAQRRAGARRAFPRPRPGDVRTLLAQPAELTPGEPIRDGRVVIAVNSNMMVRQARARPGSLRAAAVHGRARRTGAGLAAARATPAIRGVDGYPQATCATPRGSAR